MRVIGSAVGISLYVPDDAYFSYFNSPYIGHDVGSAVDIYPRHGEWGDIITAPVSGKVVRIKKMQMGRPKQFPTDEFDFGIGILPEEVDSDIVRVMHCEPTVQIGEIVDFGDQIGNAVRSRYFNYWTGPHYHIEILPFDSFHRSTKAHPLELDYHFEPRASSVLTNHSEFLIESVTEDNIIGYPKVLDYAKVGDLTGLAAISKEREVVGILDGGFSHYRLGGVIGTDQLQSGDHINLAGFPVGTVRDSKRGATVFKRGPSIITYLDETELNGISCFLYPKQFTKNKTPQLILIPKRYGEFKGVFNEGEVCKLRISHGSNMVKAD